MKKIKTFFKPVVTLLAIALTFTACSDDDDDQPTPVENQSALAVVHASPGSAELILKADGTKAHQSALTFGTIIPYSAIISKAYEFSITKKDADPVLLKSKLELKANKNYSLYIADLPEKVAFVLTEDNLAAPAADKANVRFINLSPDAGALDLGINGVATNLFNKTAFKESTSFAAVTPGAELTFEIKENTKTEVLAKLEKVKIEKGKIYTIWANGLKSAADNTKLAVKLITNK